MKKRLYGLLCLLLPTVGFTSPKAFQRGDKAYQKANYEQALAAFEEAAAANPTSAEIQYNRGNTLYQLKRFPEAQQAFEIAYSLTDRAELQQRLLYNQGNTLVQLAQTLQKDEPQAALQQCQQAAIFFQRALQAHANDADAAADAAYNLELTRRFAQTITLAIEEKQKKKDQEDELTRQIRKQLNALIKAQTQLIAQTSATNWPTASAPQSRIAAQTASLISLITASGLHTPIPTPNGPDLEGPLQKTHAHTVAAYEAMQRAIAAQTFAAGAEEQKTALAELLAALEQAPEDPDNPEGENGDEDSEWDDESDMDYEESDEESDSYEEANPFGDFSEYEEIRGFPPPNTTEMDILKEEIRNQERRKAKKGGHYKPVKNDY